ncbi:hypothetical protein AAFF_G00322770 [Aldrovandia affinis]|uniref:Catechol O-methyltransferase n=1 Tax=Aldrovandia affinis TaxID=143900 RepID=A0AAD7SMF3_9TELE|nr:hypothetical protein AAFF_G00322770 [Aldrovandia affinis]
MWRIHGLVGRLLTRCQANAPLRLSQGHHYVEDEVLSTPAVLSSGVLPSDSSSQSGGNGDRQRRRRTSQFCYTGLPRYTALDAVGWGVAAMLLMQVCRRIHSQFSSVSELNATQGPYRERGLLQRCGYRALLEILSRRDVLPRGVNVSFLGSVQAIQEGSSGSTQSTEDSSPSHMEGVSLSNDSGDHLSSSGCAAKDTSPGQNPKDKVQEPEEDELTDAANNLRRIADSSVPVILNIIGIESAKSGEYNAAFSCFLASAKHGYSKAQFNVGVCYEKGRGVNRDNDKAAEFYRQAATGGHSQAKYRYARCLLRLRSQQSVEDAHATIGLLEGAAASGVREAQAYLGVLFSQEPLRDGQKAVHYLRMAAENGDSLSGLYLGQCYEWGFGVQQSFRTAVELYKRAATAGNQQAQIILSALCSTASRVPEDTALRSIRSTPCLSTEDAVRLRFRSTFSNLQSGSPCQPLPHSWSTGSFLAQALPSPSPASSPRASGQEGAPCHPTLHLAGFAKTSWLARQPSISTDNNLYFVPSSRLLIFIMWLLAATLPLLAVMVACYWGELGALYRRLLSTTATLSWRSSVCVRSTHSFVFTNCTHGRSESVLETFDQYAQRHPSLSLGPKRGEFLDEVVQRVAPTWALELGTHCGYSSVRILRLLPAAGRLLTVEHDATAAEVGEEIILVAGFKHSQFQLLSCPSEDAIACLRTHLGKGLLQMVLMDHDVGRYLLDLRALEREGLLAPGCVLLFNDSHLPAACALLEHIASRPEQYTVQPQAQGLLEVHCHLLAGHAPQDQGQGQSQLN